MSYTSADIQEKLSKKVDYNEIIRLIELDLNTIANEIITDPNKFLDFKVFFDADDFDTTINLQAPGEGGGLYVTPVMLQLVNGNYSNEKGPEVFQLEFRIEVFGMEKDLENLRQVLEIYSSLNQGAISSNVFANALTTSIMDFPIVSDPFQYKGMTRVSLYMSWLITFIYQGQLSNEVVISLDNNEVNLQSFNIKRVRASDSTHINNQSESTTVNQSQTLVFNGGMIFDGSTAGKKLLREIKNLNMPLNTKFTLSVSYPSVDVIPEVDTYNVILTEGDIEVNAGGYVVLLFSMTLA